MQRISELLHNRRLEDYSDADHQEHVERVPGEVLMIGGAALLLLGGFIGSLL